MGDRFYSKAFREFGKSKTITDGFTLEWDAADLYNRVDAAVQVASREGAILVAKEARQRAPWRTGELATSIEIKRSKFKDGGYSVIAQGPGNYRMIARKTPVLKNVGKKNQHLSTTLSRFYAIFVELGTSDTAAQPFLRPALNANKRKINKIFKDIIEG